MEILKELIKDLAIIGILAGFIEILVPEGKTKYPIRMIFGLYIIAVMLNPFLVFFHKTDLSALDFSDLEIANIDESSSAEDNEAVLQTAAAEIAADINGKLAAMYEEYTFAATVTLTADGEATAEITVTGAPNSKEVALSGEIKKFIAGEFGLSQRKITIKFK